MFFWNNNKKKQEVPVIEMVEVADIEKLKEKIESLETDLTAALGKDRIVCLNALGSACMEIKDTEKAIRYYEMSLEEDTVFSKACTDLMSLYNIKRREAAVAKDDEQLQLYLNKIDNLMQTTKTIMRKV
ncbi:tetratricopeptide repeat protein [Propionispira raffinosivorans]|uniref:tetratricopeptide repeat protein n=1 Tax=Propionispira raffinosivorans TaxID=86959 RepID=UPI000372880C|nr:tetratricopeptide repeat protein [Propionispira raffinosivorans]